jgi:hypothetical protein
MSTQRFLVIGAMARPVNILCIIYLREVTLSARRSTRKMNARRRFGAPAPRL